METKSRVEHKDGVDSSIEKIKRLLNKPEGKSKYLKKLEAIVKHEIDKFIVKDKLINNQHLAQIEENILNKLKKLIPETEYFNQNYQSSPNKVEETKA